MALNSVECALRGFLRTTGSLELVPFEGGSYGVLRHEDTQDKGKVKLLSGGGSGHEPAHAGYVGRGMLAGAVCGQIFAAPSVGAVLECLRRLAPDPVLMIVKNYTGDRLNFGLALERARSEIGIRQQANIRMLLVGEDCSIEGNAVRPAVGKRGLAGVVLVHKILGAMADMSATLDEIERFGNWLVQNIATIGFTFELGRPDNSTTILENIEIGKGIHGEPGVSQIASAPSFDCVIDIALSKLAKQIAPSQGGILVLINNLGGTSELRMGIFTDAFSKKAIEYGYNIQRIYTGTFLSSLDKKGISVTLLNLSNSKDLLAYLDRDVEVGSSLFGRASDRFTRMVPSQVLPSRPTNLAVNQQQDSKSAHQYQWTESFGKKLVSLVIPCVCEALISCADVLNKFDQEAGDGDTGSTISKGAQLILEHFEQEKLDLLSPSNLLQQLSILVQQGMGGSSGALYSLFLHGASKSLGQNGPKGQPAQLTIEHWLEALTDGINTIVQYARTQPGDRTMLDSLREGEQRFRETILFERSASPDHALDCIRSFTVGCEVAAKRTQFMTAKAGRAAYASSTVGDQESTCYLYPDPGAKAVAIWARALLEACTKFIGKQPHV